MVYVDEPIWQLGRMKMCHMIADSEQELHEMAAAIGVDRRHYQGEAKYPHYDVCKSKRQQAVDSGAIPVSSRLLVKKARRIKQDSQCDHEYGVVDDCIRCIHCFMLQR